MTPGRDLQLFVVCQIFFLCSSFLFKPQPLCEPTGFTMTSPQPDLSTHVIPLATPLSSLQAGEAFAGLSAGEQLYCHYLARAAWEGGPICLIQTSPESVPIFLLLKELFSRQTLSSLRAAVQDSVTEDEFTALLLYTAALFTNMGNYKGFGDTKIVPGIPKVGPYNLEPIISPNSKRFFSNEGLQLHVISLYLSSNCFPMRYTLK